ncbi:hypothetical protein [Prochlorococcus marinus]|uniref:Uncharacterized protein n=1 Tax=Prochlorococcus marinus (strain MIT 9211) TaxID=93059 RepID=A9BDW4_PROM4|nr:hypothetical protein [Prochlorococcus marinus]ABX08274.1 Hypothetical protein P9211_03431 [Prochlorococcus marinus str. MIT 9211]
MEHKNNLYNNADSFSMAFDEAWKSKELSKQNLLDKEEKIRKTLEMIKDHPFIINSSKEAIKVAKFRIRLLDLQ